MAILSHFSSLMIVATFLWSNIFFQDLAFQVTILFWFTLYQIDIFFLSLLLSRFSSFLLGRTLFFFFCMIGLFCITLSRARTYQFSPRLYCFFFFVFLLMQDLNFLIGLCHLAPSFRFIILWVSFGHSHDLEISSYHYRMSPRGVDGNFCLFAWLIVGVAT